MRKVAVVVAHADDEILGCGGTIAKHSAAGDTIHVIYATPGITSRKSDNRKLDIARRRALAMVGNGNITFTVLGFPDQKLDLVGQLALTQAIEADLIPYLPDIIYTHSPEDLNRDHKEVYWAVMTAARPVVIPACIMTMEVPSSTEWGRDAFSPNYWEDISSTMKQKVAALHAYGCEMRPWPHPRSFRKVTAQAEFRGGHVCVQYAEAFHIERMKGEKVCL